MKAGPPHGEGYVPSSSPSHYREQPAIPMRQRGLWLAGYGVFAALLFVAFVTASFPYADTISSLVAPMRMRVVFQRQEMNFPLGARLENVRLLSSDDEQLLFQSPDVTIEPRVSCWLLGRPCLRIRSQIYGGALDAAVQQNAGAIDLDFELESLDLVHLIQGLGEPRAGAQSGVDEEGNAPLQLGLALSGELSANGSAQVTGPDITGSRGSVIVVGRHIKAGIVNGLPPLDLGVVSGKVLLDRGVATLQAVRANGSDGGLEANGQIRLTPDIVNSFVQLTIALTLSAKGRASFGLLLKMLPHSPSDGPYHIEGALKSPSVS
jgi:type II secretion system protein N